MTEAEAMKGKIEKVAFIGLGVMGGHMAGHVAAAFDTTVFDIDEKRRNAVAKARKAATAAEASKEADVVLLSLPGSGIVRQVTIGAQGLIGAMKPGAVVVDTSTTEPAVSREVAAELAKKGIHFLDSPVSGGEKGARDASLSIMVGGDSAIFELCKPVLQAIGKSVVHVGAFGAGEVAKLVNNMIVAATFSVIAEGFALAVKNGLDPKTLYEAIRGGWAGSTVLEVAAPGMLARNFTPGGTVDIMWKDVSYALSLAQGSNVPVPTTSQAFSVFTAARAAGLGGEAQQTIIKLWERLLGIEVGGEGRKA